MGFAVYVSLKNCFLFNLYYTFLYLYLEILEIYLLMSAQHRLLLRQIECKVQIQTTYAILDILVAIYRKVKSNRWN